MRLGEMGGGACQQSSGARASEPHQWRRTGRGNGVADGHTGGSGGRGDGMRGFLCGLDWSGERFGVEIR